MHNSFVLAVLHAELAFYLLLSSKVTPEYPLIVAWVEWYSPLHRCSLHMHMKGFHI